MNNFNYSSDYHLGPLNAFPICCSAWHRGLCHQSVWLSFAFVEMDLPSPASRLFSAALGGALYGANNNTDCINGLWKNTALVAVEGSVGLWGGYRGRLSAGALTLWFPVLSQASYHGSVARKAPARTAWIPVWKRSRREPRGTRRSSRH